LSDPSCPVCGSPDVTPIPDSVLILKQWDDVPILGYRCCNQHLFLPTPKTVVADEKRGCKSRARELHLMDSSKDETLEQLIERSRSLIRDAQELKRDQESLLRQLKDLHERTSNDDHQE
jgi:hypothetical protein